MILKPEPNKPYTISLKYKQPKKVSGRYGLQFQYVLANGDILYVPPVAHEEIKSLNPAPGEAFTLLKSISNGNAAIWSVERIAQPAAEPLPKPVAAAQSIASGRTLPPTLTTPESQRIFRQLVATIEAAKAAEEFAKSINWSVTFGSEDIRAMAISGFIEQSRRAA